MMLFNTSKVMYKGKKLDTSKFRKEYIINGLGPISKYNGGPAGTSVYCETSNSKIAKVELHFRVLESGQKCCHIKSLYVEPYHRNLSIAKNLIYVILTELSKYGFSRVTVHPVPQYEYIVTGHRALDMTELCAFYTNFSINGNSIELVNSESDVS